MVNQVATGAEGIGSSFLDFLTSKIDSADRAQKKNDWQNSLVAAIYQNIECGSTSDVSALSLPSSRRESLQSVFLDRLSYPGMQDREERITKAYENTFRWIWEDFTPSEKRWSNFKEWLESDSQLYWITGKAGSGKSTLMKLICQDDDFQDGGFGAPQQSSDPRTVLQSEGIAEAQEHPMSCSGQSRCQKHLKHWARNSKLITATFFVWNSGVNLQMTQKGLFLSLLFQILRQAPELIPSVSPTRWEALCLFNDNAREWMEQELHQMLRLATEKLSQHSKICLFVDGLDEFNGSPDDLIILFKDLIANRNVKLCVSSRPWVEFEDAFKHGPSLRLQDLSYPDIKHYVTAHFNDNSGFVQLCKREPGFADQLVNNIVNKASGVFLWVHLVVASLLTGMEFADRVSDLQKRLECLPPDLELLYEKIILSLDPFYLEHAAQLFRLVQESLDPPSLLLLSFADEEDPQFALKHPIGSLSLDEVSLREETMRRRLNSRCKGLLEVGNPLVDLGNSDDRTVQYLHRTVKDYIESGEARCKLQNAMKEPFDPHFRLCAANLVDLKVIDGTVDFLANGTLWSRVQRCLYSASRVQPMHRAGIISFLDEMDRTGISLAKQLSEYEDTLPLLKPDRGKLLNYLLRAGKWVPSHPLLSKPVIDSNFGGSFLSLAVRYGFVEFVEAKANHGCLVQDSRNKVWPLLADATYVNSVWTEYHDTVPQLDMIICLLRKGADPNFIVPTNFPSSAVSVWTQTLKHILEAFDGHSISSPWQAIARAMIKHKAEVNKDIRLLRRRNQWENTGLSRTSSKRLVPYDSSDPMLETSLGELKLLRHLSAIQRATASPAATMKPWSRWRFLLRSGMRESLLPGGV